MEQPMRGARGRASLRRPRDDTTSMDAIAASSVSKATIYKHWRTGRARLNHVVAPRAGAVPRSLQ